MTPEHFCYWLQGYFELCEEDNLTKEQIKMIREHLNLVFKHDIISSYGYGENPVSYPRFPITCGMDIKFNNADVV